MTPVANFRTRFISHSGLKIEREISHTFEIRNFPQRNIPPAKFTPPPPTVCPVTRKTTTVSGDQWPIEIVCMPRQTATSAIGPSVRQHPMCPHLGWGVSLRIIQQLLTFSVEG